MHLITFARWIMFSSFFRSSFFFAVVRIVPFSILLFNFSFYLIKLTISNRRQTKFERKKNLLELFKEILQIIIFQLSRERSGKETRVSLKFGETDLFTLEAISIERDFRVIFRRCLRMLKAKITIIYRVWVCRRQLASWHRCVIRMNFHQVTRKPICFAVTAMVESCLQPNATREWKKMKEKIILKRIKMNECELEWNATQWMSVFLAHANTRRIKRKDDAAHIVRRLHCVHQNRWFYNWIFCRTGLDSRNKK